MTNSPLDQLKEALRQATQYDSYRTGTPMVEVSSLDLRDLLAVVNAVQARRGWREAKARGLVAPLFFPEEDFDALDDNALDRLTRDVPMVSGK